LFFSIVVRMSYDSNVPADILKVSLNSLKLLGYQFSYGLRKKSPLSKAHRFISAVRDLYLLIVILNIGIYLLYHGLMVIPRHSTVTYTMYGFAATFVTLFYLKWMIDLWIQRKNIQKILTEVISAHIPMLNDINDSKKIQKIFLLIGTLRYVLIGLTIMFYVFLGLLMVMGIIRSINSTEKVHTFLMTVDVENFAGSVVFIGWIFWTFVNFSIFFISFHLLLFVSVSYILIQVLQIKAEVINVTKDIKDFNSIHLSGIVDKHVKLLKFVDNFNIIFRGSLNFMFILYPLLFCASVSICLTTNYPVDSLLTIFVFMPTASSMFILCYLCQLVKDESKDINTAIYSSNWLKIKNAQLKKALLIILKQKLCSIRAGLKSTVQMRSFLKVTLVVPFLHNPGACFYG